MVEIETLFDDSGSGGGARQLSVEPSKRLPALDQPGSEAYAVVDQGRPDQALFGLVCDPRAPVRLAAAKALCGHDIANALALIAVGRAPIGGSDAMRVLMIYQPPEGAQLVEDPDQRPVKIESRVLLTQIISPIAEALTDWEKRGLCHGAVRPENIFLSQTGRGGGQLGDGLSAPCGRWQTTVYEPLARARAMPCGRGEVGPGVDIYALAVTAVALLKGAVPCQEFDDADLMAQILARGATATIANFVDSQSSIGVALEGMLQDSLDRRWSATDVVRWIKDRVRPAALGDRQSEKRRGFVFLDTEHWSTKTLAIALAATPDKAGPVLRGGEVTDWLKTSVGERQIATTLEATLSPNNPAYSGRQPGLDELTARAVIALDPTGPITYRKTVVMPDGIGPALAEAETDTDKNAETIEDLMHIVKFGIAEFWLDQQGSPDPSVAADTAASAATLKTARIYAQRKAPGFGVRRALYDLNPTLVCRSPQVRDRMIFEVDEILLALQDSVATKPPNGRLIDRHLAGFIASKLALAESRNVAGLDAPNAEPEKIWRSTMWLLGTLHDRVIDQRFKTFARWLNVRIAAVLDELHNREARKSVAERLALVAEEGDLSAMAATPLNQKFWTADSKSFERARQHMANLRRQIYLLTDDTKVRDRKTAKLGGQFALAASYALLGFTLIFVAGTILT